MRPLYKYILLLWCLGAVTSIGPSLSDPPQPAASTLTTVGIDALPSNLTCLATPQPPPEPSSVALQPAITDWPGVGLLTIMALQPDEHTRWIVGDRNGLIYSYETGAPFRRLGLFADLRDRVTTRFGSALGGELGLLDAVFHPQFADNGVVLVYYTAKGTLPCCPVVARLSRFNSRNGGQTLDLASEVVLLEVPHSTPYHKGAAMRFGKDGYLYIGLGDGAVSSSAQDLSDLRGKMLRIDVDNGQPYGIPSDNPFVDVPNARPEVYAFGLRNPWRWSFNQDTEEIWAGDVGNLQWEEIDIVRKGGNYGWPIREGAHCRQGMSCVTNGLVDPVYEYDHGEGSAAIIGGFVYRGSAIPSLRGHYLFADGPSGKLFGLLGSSNGEPTAKGLATRNLGRTLHRLLRTPTERSTYSPASGC